MSKKCINCGANLADDDLFCGECGTKQPQAAKHCSNCGKEIPGGVKFCTHCGTPVDGTSAPASKKNAPVSKGVKNVPPNQELIGDWKLIHYSDEDMTVGPDDAEMNAHISVYEDNTCVLSRTFNGETEDMHGTWKIDGTKISFITDDDNDPDEFILRDGKLEMLDDDIEMFFGKVRLEQELIGYWKLIHYSDEDMTVGPDDAEMNAHISICKDNTCVFSRTINGETEDMRGTWEIDGTKISFITNDDNDPDEFILRNGKLEMLDDDIEMIFEKVRLEQEIIGGWTLTSGISDDITIDPEDLGISMHFDFYDDSTCAFSSTSSEGEIEDEQGIWKVDGTKIFIGSDDDDDDSLVLSFRGGKIEMLDDDVKMFFEKD